MGINKRKRALKNGKVKISYEVEVYIEGTVVARKSFETMSAAADWKVRTEKRLHSGLGKLDDDYTFGDCFRGYERSDFQLLRKSSQQARSSRFRYFLGSPIDSVKMTEFTSKTVDTWIAWLRTHGTVGNKNRISFTEELRILKLVLNWYRENRDETFIIPILKRHRARGIVKPRIHRLPDYYIKAEDVPKWLRYLKEDRPDRVYHDLALFMVLTGCRMGEAAGLCWDSVDAAQGIVRIVRTLSWDYSTKAPYFQEEVKTAESRRAIRLPPILIELLHARRIATPFTHGAVFQNAKGQLLRDNTIRDNFNISFRACGLPWSGSHIARHTSGTLALVAGSEIAKIQALLGHTNSRQTQQYAKIVALQANDAPLRTAELVGLR